jgi:hypothetical protein
MFKIKPINWKSKDPFQKTRDIDQNFSEIEMAISHIQNSTKEFLSGLIMNDVIDASRKEALSVFKLSNGNGISMTDDNGSIKISMNEDLKTRSIDSVSIKLNGNDISKTFVRRKELSNYTTPEFCNNIVKTSNDGDPPSFMIRKDPSFDKVKSKEALFQTISASTIYHNGSSILDLFSRKIKFEKPFLSKETKDGAIHVTMSDSVELGSVKLESISSKEAKFDSVEPSNISSKSGNFILNKNEISFFEKMFHISSNAVSIAENINIGKGGNISIGAPIRDDISSFNRTSLRVVSKGDGPIYNSIIIQSRKFWNDPSMKDSNVDLVVKGDGNIGIGVYNKLTSKLNIAGEGNKQLRLHNKFTPQKKEDGSGIGTIAWDEDNLYVMTSSGWKKSPLLSIL